MSRNVIVVLMHHRHELLDLIYMTMILIPRLVKYGVLDVYGRYCLQFGSVANRWLHYNIGS
jgi:hypothetical protein